MHRLIAFLHRHSGWLIPSIILAISIASSWSLFRPEFFRIHDFSQGARIAEMWRGLHDGHFPVRWSQNFGYGYGMPLFEFYAPLPYYVGGALFGLGLDLVLTIKVLYFLCTLGAAAGAYLLGKRLYGRVGGVVVAVAYTFAPYRAVNLFVRGALSEAWGMMALPWVLLGVIQVIRREKWGWVTLTLGLVALFLSHNLSTLMFVPVSLFFALKYLGIDWWHLPARARKYLDWPKLGVPFIQLVGTYALAIGIAAFYIIPALLEKNLTKVDAIFTDYFYYGNHFVGLRQLLTPNWKYGGSVPGPYDDISFFLGYGQMLAAVVAMLGALWHIWHWWQHRHKKKSLTLRPAALVISFAILLALTLFMTYQKSLPIWNFLPLMETIQFPWRWLASAAIFLALMSGAGSLFLPKHHHTFYAFLLCLGIIGGNIMFFEPEKYLADASEFYYADAGRIRSEMSTTLNDYIPKQMVKELPVANDLIVNVQPSSQSGQVTVTKNLVHHKQITTDVSVPTTIDLGIADFKGWTTREGAVYTGVSRGQLGNIQLFVRPGKHVIDVTFTDSALRTWSDLISLTSLIGFIGIVIATTWKRKNS